MKIDYRLNSEKGDLNCKCEYYNKKVTKLTTRYTLTLCLPSWIDVTYIFNLFPMRRDSKDEITLESGNLLLSGISGNKGKEYKIKFNVITTAKCSEEDDFDEIKGRRICETKAEIRALNIINKFFNRLDEFTRLDNDYVIPLGNRICKNVEHLYTLTK